MGRSAVQIDERLVDHRIGTRRRQQHFGLCQLREAGDDGIAEIENSRLLGANRCAMNNHAEKYERRCGTGNLTRMPLKHCQHAAPTLKHSGFAGV